MQTLMLTPWMSPHKIISWQRAVVLAYLGKVEVIETWDEDLVGPSISMKAPSVVRLTRGSVSTKQSVRFSRVNVFTRDKFRCQYCGERKPVRQLNYDHVIPRVQGGKTVWENIVTSCYACNDRKGSRTPEQAGMQLLKKPRKPEYLPVVPPIRIDEGELPQQWEPYCGDLLRMSPLSA
ncbi:MAG: HNH endonuclease [Deltaproteobacteria bacterium]|nr:HNH endonuclease [Deltaproteobacteria bacterium]